MSYYRRGYHWENIHYIPAPTGGWNPDANPWELADDQAHVLDNVLIRPGKVVSRGAFSVVNDLSAFAPLNLCGHVVGTSWARLSQKAVSATAYVDHWNVPLLKPAAGALAKATALGLWVPFGGATVQAGNNPVGPRWVNLGGLLYGLSYDAQLNANLTASDIQGTYTIWRNHLYTIPIAAGSGTNVTALLNAPQGSFDLKVYQSRIWMLGGVDIPGAGTTHSSVTLFFTVPIVAGGGVNSADWKDPVSGLTNKIQLSVSDADDYGVALAVVRNGLLILRRSSIEILRGSTTSSYVIQTVSRETGCIDARSVVETDRGVFFLGQKGLMLSDGAIVRNVSGTVMYTLQQALSAYLTAVSGGFGGYAYCMALSDGEILVSIGQAGVTASAPDGHVQPLWCGMYNPATNTWTRVTSAIWAAEATIIVPGNNYPGPLLSGGAQRKYTVGDKFVTQLETNAGTGVINDVRGANSSGSGLGTNANADTGQINTWVKTFGNGAFVRAQAALVTTGITILASQALVPQPFSIPTSATITGIQVDIQHHVDSALAGHVNDNSVQLMKAGAAIGTNKALGPAWPVPSTVYTYGGSADLWGTTWTPADINASAGFGVSFFQTFDSRGIPGGPFILAMEDLRITVFYTMGGGATQAQSFVLSSSLYDKLAGANNFSPIPVAWKTRFAPIIGTSSMTRAFAQAKRWFVDHVFGASGLVPTTGWSVTPVDADDNPLSSAVSVPVGSVPTTTGSVSGAAPISHPQIQRTSQDFFNEIDDIAFDVAWTDSARTAQPSAVVAELYGVGIEYQPTRDKR